MLSRLLKLSCVIDSVNFSCKKEPIANQESDSALFFSIIKKLCVARSNPILFLVFYNET